MTLLLDTHILIWAAAGTMPEKALPYVADEANALLFSPASIWEIIIKKSLNRSDFQVDPLEIYRGLLDNGYGELAITGNHVLAVDKLPPIHKDPFDRILLAQAQAERIAFLTADKTVAEYPGDVIYIRK
jgi:PIN domain nuclease of toxin-antitoxin system